MRYYEGHEAIYQRIEARGVHSWDEHLGQSEDFDAFCMRGFLEEALTNFPFTKAHPNALELGCGTGPGACFLAARGFVVEGVDVSPTAIELAKREAAQRGVNVSYRVADVCRETLGTERYDLVVDGHCLHCLVTDEDRQRALEHVRNALVPGGHFWIDSMLAVPSTKFSDRCIFDEDDVLWSAIDTPGTYALERESNGTTYVANRRIHRSRERFEEELHRANFSLVWSEVAKPEHPGEPASFRAVCVPR